MPQFATSLINAYSAGEQQRVEADRRSAISRYAPGALQGNQSDITAIGAYDPQLALGYANRANALKEEDRKRFIENSDWIATQLVRQDGSPIQTPEEISRVVTNAKARGFSGSQLDQITPEHIPGLIQASEAARNLKRQISQDELQRRVAEANINQSNAAADASRAKAGGNGGFDNQTFDNISSLRKEYSQQTKDFPQVRDAYGRIQASAKDPSAAGDLALIFNYMKVLDPGSTVREGEFATAQNATSVPGQIQAQYNKILSGERLNPSQRDDFVKRAGALYGQQKKIYEATRSNYTDLAKRFGFDPTLVTINQSGGIDEGTPAAGGDLLNQADSIVGLGR